MMVHVFGLLLSCRNRINGRSIKIILGLSKLIRSNSMLSLSFCFGLFSIAAIPPLLGFYSKFYVFLAMVEYMFFFYSGVIILLSSVGVLYYIRLIKIMYFLSFVDYSLIFLTKIGKLKSILLSYLNLLILLFFVYPAPLFLLFYNKILLFSL